MPILLGGSVLSGFGGGALISLSFVATQRYFPTRIWPQLMAILSVVWGISAFGGPLFGGLDRHPPHLALGLCHFRRARRSFSRLACLHVLRHEVACTETRNAGQFPLGGTRLPRRRASWPLPRPVSKPISPDRHGSAGRRLRRRAAVLPSSMPVRRIRACFPTATFDPRTTIGSGMIMVAALSVSTCSFGFYGPLLLAGLHDFTPSDDRADHRQRIDRLVGSVDPGRDRLAAPRTPDRHRRRLDGHRRASPASPIPFRPARSLEFCFVPCCRAADLAFSGPLPAGGSSKQRRLASATLPPPPFPRLQRLGYAVGAALTGIIANASGFSGGFTKEAAAGAAATLFWPYLPLAIIGCVASFRLAAPANDLGKN